MGGTRECGEPGNRFGVVNWELVESLMVEHVSYIASISSGLLCNLELKYASNC